MDRLMETVLLHSMEWSMDGKEILCTTDHLGQHSIFAVDVATGKSRIVVENGTSSNPRILSGGGILFGMNSLLEPTELYSVSLDGENISRITHINDARAAAAKFGKPEQFTFKSVQGETVYGYIVYPYDFHYRWNPQAYAGAGYAAVMIDFHGSTGYGQAFTDAINKDWGGAPYEDMMTGLDFALQKYPFLDKDRIAVLGASYGGYMINWIAGHTDGFKALVCHDGNLDEHMACYDT
jgi:dipeptidyl aminopeptidase/acylaminoacyl peptidase